MDTEPSERDGEVMRHIEAGLRLWKPELQIEEWRRDKMPSHYSRRRHREAQRKVSELERWRHAVIWLPILMAERVAARQPAS